MSGVSEGKDHLGIVICGHVDAGKSTTTGHLLFKLGGIKEREMEKLKEEARAQNMESFAFAFYMDRQKEERERGVLFLVLQKNFLLIIIIILLLTHLDTRILLKI